MPDHREIYNQTNFEFESVEAVVKRTIVFAAMTLLLISACSESASTGLNSPTAIPAGRCLSSRDCPADEYCQHPDARYPCGTCLEDPDLNECGDLNPCPKGQRCVTIRPPCYCGYNVCIEPCDVVGCPSGQYCSDDGTCQALDCGTEDDCGGAYCIGGRCSQSLGYCEPIEPRP
jgi:hypothetical protein